MSCLTKEEVVEYIDKCMLGTTYVTSDCYDHPKVSLKEMNPDREADIAAIREEYHLIDIRCFPLIKYKYEKYVGQRPDIPFSNYDTQKVEIMYNEVKSCELFD